MKVTKYITPEKNQGQIVHVSYAWEGDKLHRRTFDRSDRTCINEVAVVPDELIDYIDLQWTDDQVKDLDWEEVE